MTKKKECCFADSFDSFEEAKAVVLHLKIIYPEQLFVIEKKVICMVWDGIQYVFNKDQNLVTYVIHSHVITNCHDNSPNCTIL